MNLQHVASKWWPILGALAVVLVLFVLFTNTRRAQLLRELSSGKMADNVAKRFSTNPRQAWRGGNDRVGELRSFERVAVLGLHKRFKTVASTASATEERLPLADHAHFPFRAVLNEQVDDVTVLGHAHAYFFDSGVVWILGWADPQSYGRPESEFNRTLEKIQLAVSKAPTAVPREYVMALGLADWQRTPDTDCGDFATKYGGIDLSRSGVDGEYARLLVYRLAPADAAGIARNTLNEPIVRDIVRDQLESGPPGQ